MDVTNKISISARPSWKRTPSFGVDDPTDAAHYPALLSGAPKTSGRALSRMSSSFKEAVTAAQSAGVVVPVESSNKLSAPINEVAPAGSPRISAIKSTLAAGSDEPSSSSKVPSETPQRATGHDEEGFTLSKSRASRSPWATATQIQLHQNPFAVLSEADTDHATALLLAETAVPASQATTSTTSASRFESEPAGDSVSGTASTRSGPSGASVGGAALWALLVKGWGASTIKDSARASELTSQEEAEIRALIRERRHWAHVPGVKPPSSTARVGDTTAPGGLFTSVHNIYYVAGAVYGSYLGLKQGFWRK